MTEGICRVNCFVRLSKPRYHRGMTRSCLLLFTLALSVLSACAPPPLWYRSGISPTRLSQDLTACRVAALETVPHRDQESLHPGRVYLATGLYPVRALLLAARAGPPGAIRTL